MVARLEFEELADGLVWLGIPRDTRRLAKGANEVICLHSFGPLRRLMNREADLSNLSDAGARSHA